MEPSCNKFTSDIDKDLLTPTKCGFKSSIGNGGSTQNEKCAKIKVGKNGKKPEKTGKMGKNRKKPEKTGKNRKKKPKRLKEILIMYKYRNDVRKI